MTADGTTPTREQVAAYNEAAAALPEILDHPCLYPRLVHESDIEANDYNPNEVPDTELELLEKSIADDGMTMPIVVYERAATGDDAADSYVIVDGFHRVYVLTDILGREWVPVSVIDKDLAERMASTVRHNRARGDHATELMGDLVASMEDAGLDPAEVADELGMEKEEVVRLKQVVGAADELASDQYGQSWGLQPDHDDA